MSEEPRRFITEMDISREYGVLLCPAQAVSFMSIVLNTPQSFRRGCHLGLLLKSNMDREFVIWKEV